MILVKKLKILDREKVFADVLARKEAFKDCENRKIRIFPMGESIVFVKNLRFLQL